MAIGGLSAAYAVAKITGEWGGEIYQNSAQLQKKMAKGRGTPIGARGYELPVEEDGNYAHGMPVEGGNYPAGNSIQTLKPVVFTKRVMHACQLTGASMDELGKNHDNEMYTEDWVTKNLKGTLDASRKMENIYCYGTGNGRLGTVSTGASSVTQTFTGSGAGYDWTRYLRKNMAIQFVDPTTGAIRNSTPAKITNSIGPFATTITLDASVSTTTGDYAVIAGGLNQAPTGLTKIIDDGTLSSVYFQNVNRTTHPKYSANLLSPGGTNTISNSLTLMRRMLGAKMFEVIGELRRGDFQIWSHEAQWSVISSLGWTLKRYDGDAKKLDQGFTSIEWEGIPWVTEVDCPLDKVFFLNWKSIWKFENTPWGWDEKTGAIWKNVVSSTSGYNFTDKFEGHYRQIVQYGSPDPRQNGLIYNLAVPTGYYS